MARTKVKLNNNVQKYRVMYILSEKTYNKLSKKLDDDFKQLTEKGDYHVALKERIDLEKKKEKVDQDYMKEMIKDLQFVKSDIFKLSTTTEILRELLHNVEIEKEVGKMSVIFILIHNTNDVKNQYQQLEKSYRDFIPGQGEIIVIAKTNYCVAKRVFDIDNNSVLVYLSKTRS